MIKIKKNILTKLSTVAHVPFFISVHLVGNNEHFEMDAAKANESNPAQSDATTRKVVRHSVTHSNEEVVGVVKEHVAEHYLTMVTMNAPQVESEDGEDQREVSDGFSFGSTIVHKNRIIEAIGEYIRNFCLQGLVNIVKNTVTIYVKTCSNMCMPF